MLPSASPILTASRQVCLLAIIALFAGTLSACKDKAEAATTGGASPATVSTAKPVAPSELLFDFYPGPEVALHTTGGLLALTLDQFRSRWSAAAGPRGVSQVSLEPDGILNRGYRDARAELEPALKLHALLVGNRELNSVTVLASPYRKDQKEGIFAAWETLIDVAQPGATPDDHRAIYQGLGLFEPKLVGGRAFDHAGLRYLVIERRGAHSELSFKVEPVMKEVRPGMPLSIAVPDGNLPDAGRVELFFAMMPPASAGKSFREALSACQAEGLDLCTDPEWRRACAAAPEIASVETWTSSFTPDHTKLQVRGGGACDAGEGALSTDQKATRGGLCCTRAIGLSGDFARIRGPAATILAFERGENLLSDSLLKSAFAPTLEAFYLTEGVDRDRAIDLSLSYLRKIPGAYSMHDSCSAEPIADPSATLFDCLHTTFNGDKAMITRSKYRVDANGLAYVRDPTILRKSAPF